MTTVGEAGRSPHQERIAFDQGCVKRVAHELGVVAQRAEIQLPGSVVWQMIVPGPNGRPQTLVTLWVRLQRVDVVTGGATVVFTDVQHVDLVPGVEVQFRRARGDMLVVGRSGHVIVRA